MINVAYKSLVQFFSDIRQLFLEGQKCHKQQNEEEYLSSASPVYPHLLHRRKIHSGIGVGVYQGEAIEVRQNEWGYSHSYHWVIHKLEYRDLLRNNNPQIALQLRRLACLLDEYHTLSSLPLPSSQQTTVIKLDVCPLKTLYEQPPVVLAEGECDNDAIRGKLETQQEQTLKCPKCQQCPYINSRPNTRVNTNATEPTSTLCFTN